MQDPSVNLPTLEVGTELILCATGLKFKYVGFTAFAKFLYFYHLKSVCLKWSNSSPQ